MVLANVRKFIGWAILIASGVHLLLGAFLLSPLLGSVLLGVPATFAVAFFGLLLTGELRDVGRLRRGLVWTVGLAAGLTGLLAVLQWDSERQSDAADERVVRSYCAYGTQSQAQFRGCLDHVTIEEVHRLYDRGSEAAIHAIESESYARDLEGGY